MQINKAIRKVMREKGMTLESMAKAVCDGSENAVKGNKISARLNNANLTMDKVVEMLNVLGYEVVIQERKQGARRADQIVIDQIAEVS